MSLTSYILTEAIGRPVLYHFTKVETMLNIIRTDKLKVSNRYDNLSLTRNYNATIVGDLNADARIALDWNRLKDFYKIKPTEEVIELRYGYNALRDKFKDEREEVIHKDVEKLHRFVIQIDLLNVVSFNILNPELYSSPDSQRNAKLYENIPVNLVTKWEPVKV
jgi:hypothetical protein